MALQVICQTVKSTVFSLEIRDVNQTLPEILKSLEAQVCQTPMARCDATAVPSDSVGQPLPEKSLRDILLDAERAEHHGQTKLLSDALQECFAQSSALVSAPACPIVAVLGMLNAGKSSLVATFLGSPNEPHYPSPSDQRSRVLIGSGNQQGTHRFVVWLPESWKSNLGFWSFVENQLLSVFGGEFEWLSEDAAQAAHQYNDLAPRPLSDADGKITLRSPINIPLVATDPNLDRLGIALMDCPDIQTGMLPLGSSIASLNSRFEESAASIAESRFQVLAKAATLCSAFVVVLPANALHDQTVSKMLHLLEHRMPHVQRMLAVNRVPRRYRTEEIAREVGLLYRGSNLRRVYMAYNFEGPSNRDRLPTPPMELQHTSDSPLPIFFRIDGHHATQPPEPIRDEDWLIRLGSQLRANDLLADAIRSANTRLTQTVHRTLSVARAHIDQQQRQLEALHQTIADACVDFSLDPNSPSSNPKVRLQASRQVIQQIADSLERTAPWWAGPGRWVQRVAEAGKASVSGTVARLRFPEWISGGGQAVGNWVRQKLTRGESGKVVTADALCSHLAKRDRKGYLGIDESEDQRRAVRDACQRAIDRFQIESETGIDREQIDALTRRIWSEMPMRQRVLSSIAPAGLLFAPLLAVVMVPLDFGGTSVLVFASLKELLFAGAAGVGLVFASSNAIPNLAESESAWQQLSDLVALVTDEIGLERLSVGSPMRVTLGDTVREIAPISIRPQTFTRPDAPGTKWRRWVIDERCPQAIAEWLDAMEQAQRT